MPIPALAPVLRQEDVVPADENEAAGPGVLDAVELLEAFEVIS
jgi:hypothetical protein